MDEYNHGNKMYYYKRKKKSSTISFVNLDDDILFLIFTRLSITAIIGCKRVCKSWYLFISSSYFAVSYRSNPPSTSLIISKYGSFSLLELNADCNYSVKPNILPDPFGPSSWRPRLVGSCNGFLCFVNDNLVNVMNPLSGMSFMLPNPRLDNFITTRYGFGFCPKTRQYKVVEFAKYGRSTKTELNVFTLGIDSSWRRLVDKDVHFPLVSCDCAWVDDSSLQFCEVNGKGVLHWIIGKMNKAKVDYLYSFDISEEKVQTVPTPVGLKMRNRFTRSVFFNGCLCLLHRNEKDDIEFWCMKDYMVSDSWTCRIIPHTCIPRHMRYRWFHTVAVWGNEEVLMSFDASAVYYYNLKQENFTKMKLVFDNNSSIYDAVATFFVPNFLPFLKAGTAVPQMQQDGVKEQCLLMPQASKPTHLGDGCA